MNKLLVVMIMLFSNVVYAGSLEPPAGPNDAGSAMYTLEDIYDRANSGAEYEKRTGTFTEPSGPPGSTSYSTDDIMSVMPVADNTNGADVSDVADGKTFWSLRTDGSWGQQTGTLEQTPCIECSGTMNGTRWCDQGNGTIKDMDTGLIWLKKADWSGIFSWSEDIYDSANQQISSLCDGSYQSGLSDGSVYGEWRLPTKREMELLVSGNEPVSESNPRAFTGVKQWYWTSTTVSTSDSAAWYLNITNGTVSTITKTGAALNIMAVRNDY